ncbi:hypothetical protein B5807_00215 [Epicoccum nigrum]|uniref:Uncharacterized protein n=1 Tax=Epicoccum nigrum TaxID=105696 RepID=A0A1Y2MH86_EPING|nr:hypothetical protein B5807_00215 [Epicoccum nigrum]
MPLRLPSSPSRRRPESLPGTSVLFASRELIHAILKGLPLAVAESSVTAHFLKNKFAFHVCLEGRACMRPAPSNPGGGGDTLQVQILPLVVEHRDIPHPQTHNVQFFLEANQPGPKHDLPEDCKTDKSVWRSQDASWTPDAAPMASIARPCSSRVHRDSKAVASAYRLQQMYFLSGWGRILIG